MHNFQLQNSYAVLLLLQFLEDQGLYESVDESSLREEVLGTLDKLVKDWVKNVGRAAELADTFVADSNAKIFTFGSYRLGVHGPGAVLLMSEWVIKLDHKGTQYHCSIIFRL